MDFKKAVSVKLKPLGIMEGDSDVSILLTSLKERLGSWQDQIDNKAEIEKQISELDGERKRLDAVIETKISNLLEKQTALETLRKEYEAGNSERRELFGIKSPDSEEASLTKAITDSEQAEKPARTAHDEAQH